MNTLLTVVVEYVIGGGMIACLAGLILAGTIWVEPQIYRSVKNLCSLLGLDDRLVFSVIAAESGFRQKALSPAGAIGLMQVMPANLNALGADKESVLENLMAGTILLKRYLRMFSGNLNQALAAYNAGPAAVKRYGQVPPYQETRRYLARINHALKHNVYTCRGGEDGVEKDKR